MNLLHFENLFQQRYSRNTAELIVKYQSINTLKQFEIIADLNIEIKQKLNLTDTTKSIMC